MQTVNMPRRRAARNQSKTESTDPDASILADGTDDKVLKKEAFLRDFDLQVQKRIASMEAKKNSLVRDITRLFSSEKLKIKKEIRQMTVQEFLVKGGDLKTLDFSSVGNAVTQDISFVECGSSDETIILKPPTTTAAPRTRKRGLQISESPLVTDLPLSRTTRGKSRKPLINSSLITPNITGGKRGMHLQTPLITPKFDPRQPLTAAREPKRGETLISLAGSPVLQTSRDASTDNENLLSLCLNKQQTLLGGTLFEETMSPGTLVRNKERLQEAISAINSRLEDLDAQVSGQSTCLNVT